MKQQVWIDKIGGRHFHKSNCSMVKEPRYHYKSVSRVLKTRKPFYSRIVRDIRVDGKYYMPCPACFAKRS